MKPQSLKNAAVFCKDAKIPGTRKTGSLNFVLNILGSFVHNIFHASLLEPVIFKWILDFAKNCVPVV